MDPFVMAAWVWTLVGLCILAVKARDGWRIASKWGRRQLAYAKRYRRHLRTRNTPPAAGQRWASARTGDRFRINAIYDNGVIGMENGGGSWGDRPDDWKRRVVYSRLYLD